ncbi:fimbrillin family protein [Bacteroides sp.]
MKKTFGLSILSLLLLAGCGNDEPSGKVLSNEIRLSTAISGITTSTRAAIEAGYDQSLDVAFARIDQTGADAWEAYSTKSLLKATRDGSGTINFAEGQYYLDSYGTKLIGWYPQTATLADGKVTFALDGYTDAMLTNEGSGTKVAPFAKLTFNHLLSKISVKAQLKKEGTSALGTITSIKVKGLPTSGEVTLPDAIITTSGSADVAIKKVDDSAMDVVVPAVTATDCGYALGALNGAEKVTLNVVTSDGTTQDVDVLLGAPAEAGKNYIVTLSIPVAGEGKSPITAISDIAPWIDENVTAELVSTTTNLSLAGNANCYIVTKAGKYTFDATVAGNGGYSPDSRPTSIAPKSAQVIWETKAIGSVVKNVTLDGNNVVFETGDDAEGNAVIAVYDNATPGSGNIVWSWHIWRLNGSGPESVKCYKWTATGTTAEFTMLDRNLGAYNNTPGNEGAIGLLYEWGRKDPFPHVGCKLSGISAMTVAGVLPYNRINTVNTIDYTIQNPSTLIYNNNGWVSGLSAVSNLWGNTTTGKESFYENGQELLKYEGTKSIYDPCPAGYRVPLHDTFTKLFAWDGTTLQLSKHEKGGALTNAGAMSDNALYFPVADWTNPGNGAIVSNSAFVNIWLSVAENAKNAYFMNFVNGTATLLGPNSIAIDLQMRCIAE